MAKEAERQILEAKGALQQTRELWWEPEVLRIEGDVRLAQGDRNGAEAGYRAALDIAKRQGAVSWERRANASLEALS